MRTKKSKLFFFFLIFVNAFDPETTTIKSNWLSVELRTFRDSSPHSWEK